MFTSNSTKLNSVPIIAYNSNVHFARNVPFSQTRSHIGREGREGDTEGGIHVTHFHPELHTIIAKSEISTTHIDPHNTMGTTTVSVVLF